MTTFFSFELDLSTENPCDEDFDVHCTHCKTGFFIQWDEGPVIGDHNGFCPSCGKVMSITVKPQYTTT